MEEPIDTIYFDKEIWKINQAFYWKPYRNVVENNFISQK